MRSGIDQGGIEAAIRPQDDLFRHTNGSWVDTVQIPADRGRYGSFDRLREQAEHDLRALVEELVESRPDPSTPAGKLATLYAAFLDEPAVAARGLGRVAGILERVAAVPDRAELLRLLGELEREGVSGAFDCYVNTDDRRSDRYVTYLQQGGLGLPDESYYRDERLRRGARDIPAACPTDAHPRRVARPAGRDAERIIALETRLAARTWTGSPTATPWRPTTC
jgi:putative endopeptidase